MRKFATIMLGSVLVAGSMYWAFSERDYRWPLPEHMPRPEVPTDNPMTTSKIALGRRLFYDSRLSVHGTTSCATCHIQALAFTDGKPRAIGATGEIHPRGSMSLVNAAYASRLTWANPLLEFLEDQALTPMFGEKPIEMGMGGREDILVELLRTDERYADFFPSAFPDDADPHSILNAVRAIAAFVRSIVSFESPYDAYLTGDLTAMSSSAERGLAFTTRGSTAWMRKARTRWTIPVFFDMTGERRDVGRFRAPTLRNVAVTAPYMHDGSIATLEEVIAHYERGGRLIADGPNAGDGRRSPFKSEFLNGFELTDAERNDLTSFLNALTDETVLTDPTLSDPFQQGDQAGQRSTATSERSGNS